MTQRFLVRRLPSEFLQKLYRKSWTPILWDKLDSCAKRRASVVSVTGDSESFGLCQMASGSTHSQYNAFKELCLQTVSGQILFSSLLIVVIACSNLLYNVLRSAVGMAHVLRSGLVMDYTTSYIHLSIEAQCVTTLLPLGDCHTMHVKRIVLSVC